TPASLPSPSRCRSANAYLPLPVYNVPGTLTAGNGTDVNTFAVVSNPSGGTSTLTATPEDTSNPSGDSVSNLFGGNFNDSTDTVSGGSSANTLAGIAITANAATATQVVWRYSLDGGTTWNTIPTSGLGDTTAILLPSTAKLSFQRAANWNG